MVRSISGKRFSQSIRVKFVMICSLVFAMLILAVLIVNHQYLNRQSYKDMIRNDAIALEQISDNVELLTDLVIKSVINLYSDDDVKLFFSRYSSTLPDSFLSSSSQNIERTRHLQRVKDVLRSNSIIYTSLDGGTLLITDSGCGYASWQILNDSSLSDLLTHKPEWEAYFDRNPNSRYLWYLFNNRSPISFDVKEGTDALACIYKFNKEVGADNYIVMLFSCNALKECFSDYVANDSSHQLFLCQMDGRTIYSSGVENRQRFVDTESFDRIVQQHKMGKIRGDFRTREFTYNYATVSSRNWLLISKVSNEYVSDHVQRMIQLNILLFFVACLAAAFSISIYYRHFERRLQNLKITMRDAANADYQTEYQVTVGDEIDEIGESFNNMIQDIRGYMDQLVEETRQKKENELSFLHAQINTHFLYNTLNSIKMLAVLGRNQEIQQMITSLVRFLKATVNVSNVLVSLEDELGIVQHYVEMQNIIRLQHVELWLDVRVNAQEYTVPKLLLQPILENSFRHAFKGNADDYRILIDVDFDDSYLVIRLSDNGCGMEKIDLNVNRDIRTTKIGLKNVEERLNLFYGDEGFMTISSMPHQGTEVILKIPADKAKRLDKL